MLNIVKQVLWDRVKNRVGASELPYHESIELIYDVDKVVSLRYEVTKNALVEIPEVEVFVENLPVEHSGKKGYVQVTFPVTYTPDCSIARVFMQNWPQELDDFLPELEAELIRQWNG